MVLITLKDVASAARAAVDGLEILEMFQIVEIIEWKHDNKHVFEVLGRLSLAVSGVGVLLHEEIFILDGLLVLHVDQIAELVVKILISVGFQHLLNDVMWLESRHAVVLTCLDMHIFGNRLEQLDFGLAVSWVAVLAGIRFLGTGIHGAGADSALNIKHALEHLLETQIDEILQQGQVTISIFGRGERESDQFGLRLPNSLQDIALAVCLLRFADEVVAEVDLDLIVGGNLEAINGEEDGVPGEKSLVEFYLEADGLSAEFEAEIVVLECKVDGLRAVLILIVLELQGVGDGFLVEIDLLLENQLGEGMFEVNIDHELIAFSAADGQNGERFDFLAYLVVHEHQQFLEHARLVEQVVLPQQVHSVKFLV